MAVAEVKIGLNGDEKSAMATPDGRSRTKKHTSSIKLPNSMSIIINDRTIPPIQILVNTSH